MEILIADDDLISRRILQALLTKWAYHVDAACDGNEALEKLSCADPPRLAILDWMMPGLDGVEVCRKLRKLEQPNSTYIIIVTSRADRGDIIEGLAAGADDYVCKPFDNDELHSRVEVGRRIVGLQSALSQRVQELEDTLNHLKTLQGILPICSYCKKIRDDQNYWQQVESYMNKHSGVEFSHSICPSCYEKHVIPMLQADYRE